MTHDQFRAALSEHHTSVIAAGIQAGHSLKVMNLSRRIEDLLAMAYDRGRMARESADEGDHAQALIHHKRSQSFIADARALIDTPHGREAHRLYLERTGQ